MKNSYFLFASSLLFLLSIGIYRKKAIKSRLSMTLMMLLASLNIISITFIIGCLHFTQTDMRWSVIYTLTHALQGADIQSYFLPISLLVVAAVAVGILVRFCLGKPSQGGRRSFDVLSLFIAMVAVCVSPVVVQVSELLMGQWGSLSDEFDRYYITQRETIKHPEYNLVYIYAESLEQTWFDEQRFPHLLPELSQNLGQAMRFTSTQQLPGTGFTIGGIVASQCGLPLFFPLNINNQNVVNHFYPDAICLGDILKKSGYQNYFYQGADLHFSDKDVFLKTHGFDHIYGSFELRDKAKAGYRHLWGLYDDTVLDAAWDKFVELSEKNQRFSLFALTVDTHPPHGFISDNCQRKTYQVNGENNVSLAAISCSQEIISRFIHRIKASKWGAKTIVVLSSDHLSMSNDATDLLPEDSAKRQDLFAIFNVQQPGAVALNKPRSTLDNGATVLEALGGANQIGLGRSSLSLASLSERFTSFSSKLEKEWIANIIELWKTSKKVTEYTLLAQKERIDVEGTKYPLPFMLLFHDEQVYPMVNGYQGLRSAYLTAQYGARFIWVDRCYILGLLQTSSTVFSRSPQWCIARGYKGGNAQLRPLGDQDITEAVWFPQPELDREKERAITRIVRSDAALRYDSASVQFKLPGLPSFLKNMEGLSRVESWGRWSNSLIAPDVTLEYQQPLPKTFRLRLTAKAYGRNVGQPVIIQVGDEKHEAVFGATPSVFELSFSNSSDASTITLTPPYPELDVQEGNWSPLDKTGRFIGIGLMELQVIPQ